MSHKAMVTVMPARDSLSAIAIDHIFAVRPCAGQSVTVKGVGGRITSVSSMKHAGDKFWVVVIQADEEWTVKALNKALTA